MAKKVVETSGKNTLVSQSDSQRDPYKVTGSDFSAKEVNAATGQDGAYGASEGHNQLAAQSENQVGPRYIEDGGAGSGPGTPTDWESGGRSAKVAAAFPVKTSKGDGSSVSLEYGVDCTTGKITGGSRTAYGEVPDHNVSIGKSSR